MPENSENKPVITGLAFGFNGMPKSERQRIALGKVILRLNPKIPRIAIIPFSPEDSALVAELERASKFFPGSTVQALIFSGNNITFFETLHALGVDKHGTNCVLFIDSNPETLDSAKSAGFETAYFDYNRDSPGQLEQILAKHMMLES